MPKYQYTREELNEIINRLQIELLTLKRERNVSPQAVDAKKKELNYFRKMRDEIAAAESSKIDNLDDIDID